MNGTISDLWARRGFQIQVDIQHIHGVPGLLGDDFEDSTGDCIR